ncbi:MAG: hypothetical protein Pg6C_01980 [Treponemataceae bacterium]|nr:MAG: hypothetical protein Pg6C_01980 [Treponemataceae bacterium]
MEGRGKTAPRGNRRGKRAVGTRRRGAQRGIFHIPAVRPPLCAPENRPKPGRENRPRVVLDSRLSVLPSARILSLPDVQKRSSCAATTLTRKRRNSCGAWGHVIQIDLTKRLLLRRQGLILPAGCRRRVSLRVLQCKTRREKTPRIAFFRLTPLPRCRA